MAASAVDRLLDLPAKTRQAIIAKLTSAERQALFAQIEYRKANPWLRYEGDPVGFVEKCLQETVWSKQREILTSLVENKRTVVPACHAPGKTHIASRAAAYWLSVYPIGTAKVLTTATNFKQVKNIMWPHIRRLQRKHELPGYTNTVEWMMGDPAEAAGEGIKPPDDEEAGMQGYHAPNLLLIVDEGGGIKDAFGRSMEALMTGSNTRLLVLGNPPTDQEGTWFERICSNPQYNMIRISAFDTPNFTGEDSGWCKSCPPGVVPHKVATHLVDEDYVNDIRREMGEDSPWYIARILADFPRDNTAKALPISWLESAQKNTEAQTGTRIRLGVDIASDGGDEFTIAQADGYRVKLIHAKAGSDNEDAIKVAGVILQKIREAEAIHVERGIKDKVRVKVDSIGVGWGVVSLLKQWERERKFNAEIVGVNVSEKARDSEKFTNQRAELWWNMRQLIQPDSEGEQSVWLDVSTKELAQLNAPTYKIDSAGRIAIEKKADLKKRGTHSPDRAEAMLLAIYEPPSTKVTVKPIGIGQSNPWAAVSVVR